MAQSKAFPDWSRSAGSSRIPRLIRVVIETARMAPMLYHGVAAFGVPIVRIESRQAYQEPKTLSTHNTDRNYARGLAQLARTGFSSRCT